MKTLLTFIFCLVALAASGQIYKGGLISGSDDYHQKYCEMKINKDSTIFLIFCHDWNCRYFECKGSIRKVQDSFKMEIVSVFAEIEGKGHPGITEVGGDCASIKKVNLRYEDGYKVAYDLDKLPVETEKTASYCSYHARIMLDPKHFHYRDSLNDYDGLTQRVFTTPVYLDIGHINPINAEPVIFRIWDATHLFGYQAPDAKFDIISCKENKIKIIANGPYIYGTYVLAKTN